jgi:cytosine/adenosine deaminase-related metal-dependent hydrolase
VLLLADWVVPVSSAPLADAGVRVAGGKIVEVGPAAELRARCGDEETRSFPGCVLLPGFVNSHTHLELSAFRGFARPSGFGRWMLRLLLARRKLDAADYEDSALWGAYECLRCGVV